jgi:hypothetical protein
VHALLAIVSALVFAVAALGWPLAALARKVGLGAERSATARVAVPALVRTLAWLTALSGLAFGLGIGIALTSVDPFTLMGTLPGWLVALFALPLLTLALALALAWSVWRERASPSWTRGGRARIALVFAAAIAFALFCWIYNLIGLPR